MSSICLQQMQNLQPLDQSQDIQRFTYLALGIHILPFKLSAVVLCLQLSSLCGLQCSKDHTQVLKSDLGITHALKVNDSRNDSRFQWIIGMQALNSRTHRPASSHRLFPSHFLIPHTHTRAQVMQTKVRTLELFYRHLCLET